MLKVKAQGQQDAKESLQARIGGVRMVLSNKAYRVVLLAHLWVVVVQYLPYAIRLN